MKKVLGLVLVAAFLVSSLGFAPAASAEAPSSEGAQATGAGVLTAQGDGIAVLGGRGVVDLSGDGVLWVRDLTGNAIIDVTGYGEKEVFDDGWIQYAGFHGTAHIEGGLIIVVISGVDIDLHAQGRGRVILWGHGTCAMNGEPYEWNMRRGLRMRLHSGECDAGLCQQSRLHSGEHNAASAGRPD